MWDFSLTRQTLIAVLMLIFLCVIPLVNGEGIRDDYVKPSDIPTPAYNPSTPAKIKLGQRLFFDRRLSGGNTMSCATCHIPEFGWTDKKRFSLGESGAPRPRRTPPLQDIAWNNLFARDGRVETLEGFILGPITHPGEMNQPLNELTPELIESGAYTALYRSAYGDEPIIIDGFIQALASYVRTLRSGISPFDRWIGGEDKAISKSAKNGFEVFNGKAGCSACHFGWRFSDQKFHDIGLDTSDTGRGSIQPDDDLMKFAFKTPSLRNVALRPPYMHNGLMESLEQVIDFYISGGEDRPSRSPLIRPIELSAHERLNLVEFLKSLTDDNR